MNRYVNVNIKSGMCVECGNTRDDLYRGRCSPCRVGQHDRPKGGAKIKQKGRKR